MSVILPHSCIPYGNVLYLCSSFVIGCSSAGLHGQAIWLDWMNRPPEDCEMAALHVPGGGGEDEDRIEFGMEICLFPGP